MYELQSQVSAIYTTQFTVDMVAAHLDRSACANLTARATRVSLRSLAVLLLTWVTSRTALRRTLLLASVLLLALRWVSTGLLAVLLLGRLSVLASLGRLAILRLALRRTVLAGWGSAVLAALRWATVALLRRATVALLRRSAVAASWGTAVAARCRVGLFVLGVVGAVDSAKKELDDP